METVLLRPHHGLCIRFFEGKGYSGEFTEHMAEVIRNLDKDTQIRITAGCDCICGKCPNYNGTKCGSEDHVMSFDREVMVFAGISPEQKLTYGEFQNKIEEGIFIPGRFELVCGDCAWGEICHKDKI